MCDHAEDRRLSGFIQQHIQHRCDLFTCSCSPSIPCKFDQIKPRQSYEDTSLTPNKKQEKRPSPSSGAKADVAFGSRRQTWSTEMDCDFSQLRMSSACAAPLAVEGTDDASRDAARERAAVSERCVKCTALSLPASASICYCMDLKSFWLNMERIDSAHLIFEFNPLWEGLRRIVVGLHMFYRQQ